jgi:hypothetical protein
MTEFIKLSFMLFILAAVSMPATAGDRVVRRVPAGAVAFQFVADLSFITGELVGYVAFIEGVDSPLLSGPPSKDTAYFSVRLTALTPPPNFLPVETTPALSVLLAEPAGAEFTVFLDSSPGPRDWYIPDTFSEGVPIAVFEESALLNTLTSGVGINVFSSPLIDSAPVEFNGQRIDFKKLVPDGVTITNAASPRADFSGSGFGATAIAIGGKLSGESEDWRSILPVPHTRAVSGSVARAPKPGKAGREPCPAEWSASSCL